MRDDVPEPQKLRIVLCMGEYCNLGRRADALLRVLQPLIAQINAEGLASNPLVKLETARCLSMCAVGPNCIVYPNQAVFNRLDAVGLQQLIRMYLPQLGDA
jgi:(2Fe-2S) ferredoxin